MVNFAKRLRQNQAKMGDTRRGRARIQSKRAQEAAAAKAAKATTTAAVVAAVAVR